MITITSGPERIDVDALWCGLALCEVKKLIGEEVALCLSPVWGPTVIPVMSEWIKERESWYDVMRGKIEDHNTKLLIVDASDYNYLVRHYSPDQIVGIVDHHMGSEQIWNNLIADRAQIEPVGACATQIVEIAYGEGVIGKLQDVTLKGLYCAIISNTLNFQAEVTHQRDHDAAALLLNELTNRGHNEDIKKQYFEEQDREIQRDPIGSLVKDTKFDVLIGSTTITIGQLEVWNGKSFVNRNYSELKQLMLSQPHGRIFISIPSISEGENYVLCDDHHIRSVLEEIAGCTFIGDMMITDRLRMRKEFIRDLLAKSH